MIGRFVKKRLCQINLIALFDSVKRLVVKGDVVDMVHLDF